MKDPRAAAVIYRKGIVECSPRGSVVAAGASKDGVPPYEGLRADRRYGY